MVAILCKFESCSGQKVQILEKSKKIEKVIKIKKSIQEETNGKMPKMLCVLCGMSSAAYQRPDGVFVIPLTALAP